MDSGYCAGTMQQFRNLCSIHRHYLFWWRTVWWQRDKQCLTWELKGEYTRYERWFEMKDRGRGVQFHDGKRIREAVPLQSRRLALVLLWQRVYWREIMASPQWVNQSWWHEAREVERALSADKLSESWTQLRRHASSKNPHPSLTLPYVSLAVDYVCPDNLSQPIQLLRCLVCFLITWWMCRTGNVSVAVWFSLITCLHNV